MPGLLYQVNSLAKWPSSSPRGIITVEMLSILRKARLKDKELRILML